MKCEEGTASPCVTKETIRSGWVWWVEAFDELAEDGLKFRFVLVWVFEDEVDDFLIVVSGLLVIAPGLIDHAETIVAVVHFGEPHQEVAGGLLGLVELAGADEVDSGVRRDGQFVLFVVLGSEARYDGGSRFLKVQVLSARLASTLASSSRWAASSLARQHFLYLLPLPQGHGSLRPGLAIVVNALEPRRMDPMYSTLLADATFHQLLLAFDQDDHHQVNSTTATAIFAEIVQNIKLLRSKPNTWRNALLRR